MTNTAPRSLPLLFALLVAVLLGLTLLHSTPAQAHEAVCSTDLDCAAYELQQAVQSGEVIAEDLTFPSASALYGAKSELLADAFWADPRIAGKDWSAARYYLGAWVECYRSA